MGLQMNRFKPEEIDHLALAERVVSLANDVFDDKDKAYAWLRRPNRSLENRAPLDLLHTEIKIHYVETLLDRIQHGVYS